MCPRSEDRSSETSLFSKRRTSQPAEYLVAHIDGGARGNPGPAGYGVVIEDQSGRRVAELSEYLGQRTNNYAEYHGLLAALDYAQAHEPRAVKVVSDSELLVRQMKGVYKVKNPVLRELYEKAQEVARHLEWFEIGHVRREENSDADRLANEAMDRGQARRTAGTAAGAGSGNAGKRQAAADKELNGIVRNGVVELLSGELPEGTMVKVRVKK